MTTKEPPAWLNVLRKIGGFDPLPSPSATDAEQPATAENAAAETEEDAPLFTPVQAKPSAGKKALRIMVWVVLILILWIGVRTIIWGNKARQEAAPVPISATFPTATAEGVASRFAVAFLTWEEGDAGAKTRAEALRPFFASTGEVDGRMGWNGKGKQRAENPTVMRVQVIDEKTARVLVLVDIINGEKRSSGGLEMTVKVIDGAGVVVGNPGVVAAPAAPTIPARQEVFSDDSQLTAQTKSEAQSFFSLFATGDNLDSIAAPGAKIRGLKGSWGTATVTKWTVSEGGADRRTATAEVTFDRDGVQIKQAFTLSIVKVSAGSVDQWKISEVHGGY